VPDLVTHVVSAYLVRRPGEVFRPSESDADGRALFYMGVMLPDLLSRPWYILFPSVHDWVFAFHTPAGMVAVAGLLASRFEKPLRQTAFRLLAAGGVLHFLLDCLQKQVTPNNFWLFPFSYRNFGIGLFWAGEAVRLVPLWLGSCVLFEIGLRLVRSRTARTANESRG
jgi:hypothetical protein